MIFRRQQTIETPIDYVNLINTKLSPRIHWIEMEQSHFKCHSKWLSGKYFEQRKDIHGHPCHFSEMVHFNFGIGERVDPNDNEVKVFSHPGFVWMRRTLNPEEEPTVLDLRIAAAQENVLDRNNLKLLNNRPIKLSEKNVAIYSTCANILVLMLKLITKTLPKTSRLHSSIRVVFKNS